IVWNTPPGITEPQIEQDYDEMAAVAMMGDSRVMLDDYEDDKLNQTLDGVMHWAGLRSKYFTSIIIPCFKKAVFDLGWFYIPFGVLVVVGASNSVNLTDGLDGLAIGSISVAAATYIIFCYLSGHLEFSSYLQIPYIPQGGELAVYLAAVGGACLGFLWYNSHPAEVFMGDVGSLALGAAIGSVALIIKQELLLVLVGGLFVMEALSVIIQVISFKLTGKRVFKMAPLHHHFELSGWSESKVVIRFWIISLVLALFALSTLKLR
ncbi:MAG: phospho-N-acetylmuramoyl-pentapeptide-transferase, partial [Candidatus Dadabacteria bacterium]|nr:phospho-N-acetylmuramoyl-pentapeptide-transferase [Candidatus Dadabacteria bacterium]